ncbi:ion transporter [Inquilinus sp. Marseille-Q2685]|uniref:ion transporter n=1 Tax=Inquilinus sp. Marseille-Q2685 TaxID=2866581 RepID=UPI00272B2254|nr:ion transporter [Inquilinus sp. Marseille-Q2685]
MDWRKHVRTALDGRHPGLGHRVELGLHALILYSALSMGVETLPHLPGWAQTALSVSEAAVVAVFTLEYLLRLATAPAPGAYARSFFGIVDLLAIAPFYLGLVFIGFGLDLRAGRALRVLRLVRLLKLARYTSAVDRLIAAWRAVKEEVVVFGMAAIIVLYVCALVIWQFEHDAQPEAFGSVFDAMWWAAVTLTTVGYGDVTPVTAVGRIFTVLMLFVALGIIAIPTGLVASALSAIRQKEASAAAEDREAGRRPATAARD